MSPERPPVAGGTASGPGAAAAAAGHGEVRLAREITLLDATMLGVGALMGGGVFVLLGIAAGVAGPALILALFLNGFITIPTLMVYAELGSASDDAGGGYLWVKQGLGQPFGFLGGWLGWFSHVIACSLYSLASAAFALFIAQSAGWIEIEPQMVTYLALGFAALFTAFNYGGVKMGIRTENAINLVVLAVVVVFIGFGLFEASQHPDTVSFNFDPFFPPGTTLAGLSSVFLAMGITFIAFEGYEIIAQTSEEIQNPRRNIPRAIWYSFLIAWVVMLLVAFIAFGVTKFVDGEQSWLFLADAKEHALVEAAGQIMPYGAIIMAGAAMLLQITALNATIYSSSRVSFAMGRDGNLPRFFGKIHPTRRTPHNAVLGSGVLVLVMALLPIATVAVAADVMFLLLFLIVNTAYIKLRKTIPQERFGFRAPFFPYIPLLGIAGKSFLAIYLWKYSHIAWYVTLAWIAVGLVLYYTYIRPHEAKHPLVEFTPLAAAPTTPRVRKSYRILVLLSSPAPSTARGLARAAGAMAKTLDGEVLLLQPIVVPEVTPLREAADSFRPPPSLEEARLAVPAAAPVQTLVRAGHNLDSMVRSIVAEEGISLLMLSGQARATVGSPTSSLIAFPPCDLAVLRHKNDVPPMRVLVASQGGSHASLAVRLGTALAKAHGGNVVLYHVRGADEADAESGMAWGKILLDHHAVDGVKTEMEMHASMRPLQQVIEKARGFDLVVVGTNSRGVWSKSLLGPRAQEIAENVTANVLIVRSHPGMLGSRGHFGRRLMVLRRYFLPE